VAIENARLFERVRAQAATLLLLNEVSREMSSILDVEELLRRAAEQVKRVIDYQILSIMLYEKSRKIFRHRLDVKHGQRVQGNCECGERRHRGRGGYIARTGTGAGRDTGPAIFARESGDAVGAGDSDACTRGEFWCAGFGEPATECFTQDHVQTLSILAANMAGVARKRAAL